VSEEQVMNEPHKESGTHLALTSGSDVIEEALQTARALEDLLQRASDEMHYGHDVRIASALAGTLADQIASLQHSRAA
jgi:hypothetical protein